MPLSLGTRLASYEIVAPIGAGGMGEVYRAQDTNLGREVAIKVLPEASAHDPERLARFEREAKTLASLNHPNIAIIHGLERADNVLAIVMELVEGLTLADRIAHGPIPVDEALPIAKQIAEALEAAHEQGIIHRDLKPANIKLRPNGTVRVLDFGLAKAVEPPGLQSSSQSMSPRITTPAMTQMGMILGTAAYMSPEQAKGKPVDKRSDVWAFGCVLYEMLTRSRAFSGEEVTEVLRADVDWTKLPDLHPRLVEVLKRCLRKDPGRRPRDIGDLRIELDEVSADPEGMSLVATADGGKALTSRRTLAMASLVGFLTALIVTVAFWTTRPLSEAEPPALSFHVTPPANTEFQFSPSGGGSAISPDGRTVAFVAVTNGTPRLWIRALDSLTAHELPDTDGAKQPFWSPDSGSIGFFTSNDLRRIDISGQKAVILARALDARGGTWNADGTIVFNPVGRGPLYQISASGGGPAPLTTMSAAEYSQRWPTFLPDGRQFLYSRVADGS